MGATTFTKEERFGLGVAILAHIGLLAVLLFRPPPGDIVKPPDRIEVTISDEVGLTSTSPEPMAAAAPDVAPTIGEQAPPEPEMAEPAPIEPAPVTQPQRPRPAPVAAARPTPRPVTQPRSQPAPPPRRTETPVRRPPAKTGGSRVGNDFLEGTPGAQESGRSTSPRAATIGPSVRSALSGAITRQLKPHWAAPQGADAEQLVTILSWNLNPDGSLAGTPRVVRQEGINDANQAQASRHAEQAIRAVQLAAPFDLPSEYYDGWKRISSFGFDKRLSQ